MSNRRRLPGRERKPKRRCPKCGSRSFQVKSYPDAFLFICRGCRFPVRELRNP